MQLNSARTWQARAAGLQIGGEFERTRVDPTLDHVVHVELTASFPRAMTVCKTLQETRARYQ